LSERGGASGTRERAARGGGVAGDETAIERPGLVAARRADHDHAARGVLRVLVRLDPLGGAVRNDDRRRSADHEVDRAGGVDEMARRDARVGLGRRGEIDAHELGAEADALRGRRRGAEGGGHRAQGGQRERVFLCVFVGDRGRERVELVRVELVSESRFHFRTELFGQIGVERVGRPGDGFAGAGKEACALVRQRRRDRCGRIRGPAADVGIGALPERSAAGHGRRRRAQRDRLLDDGTEIVSRRGRRAVGGGGVLAGGLSGRWCAGAAGWDREDAARAKECGGEG